MYHTDFDCDGFEPAAPLPDLSTALPELDPTLWQGLDPWLGDWRETD